jgi:hypothetical protein
MAHVIPTLRIATLRAYTAPAMRHKTETPPSTGDPAPAADFQTELQQQASPSATASASPLALWAATARPMAPVVTTPVDTSPTMAPTAQALFGDSPWSTTAGGTGPGCTYSYNPYYFATPQTADKVAQMLGGTVVAQSAITAYGPFQQSEPNLMVRMPDGKLINAGLVAGFYDHGYSQQTVDNMIAAEISGNTMTS